MPDTSTDFIDFCEQNGEVSNDKNQESMAADSRTISEISMEHVDFGYGEKKGSDRISVFG